MFPFCCSYVSGSAKMQSGNLLNHLLLQSLGIVCCFFNYCISLYYLWRKLWWHSQSNDVYWGKVSIKSPAWNIDWSTETSPLYLWFEMEKICEKRKGFYCELVDSFNQIYSYGIFIREYCLLIHLIGNWKIWWEIREGFFVKTVTPESLGLSYSCYKIASLAFEIWKLPVVIMKIMKVAVIGSY